MSGSQAASIARFDQDAARAQEVLFAAVHAVAADGSDEAAERVLTPIMAEPGPWVLLVLRGLAMVAGCLPGPLGDHECDSPGCATGGPLLDALFAGEFSAVRGRVVALAAGPMVVRVDLTAWLVNGLAMAVEAGVLNIDRERSSQIPGVQW